VGLTLVRRLLDEGHEVCIYDLNDPDAPDLAGNVRIIRGDLRDRERLRTAIRGCDAVFHIAAMVPLTRAGRGFWEVNVEGTANAVEAALDYHVSHFVHLSSSAIYGVPDKLPIREDDPPRPLGVYGRSKLAGERIVQEARSRGLRAAVIRPRTIVGPGRLGIFDMLFEWIQSGRPIFILGAGNVPFQLLSNRDMAEAMVLANRLGADGEFNVGSDRYRTMREDLNEVAERAGSGSRVIGVPGWLARPGLTALDRLRLSPLVDWHYKTIDKEYWFDNERPRSVLGYRPLDSNVDMLYEAYQWYASQSPERRAVAHSAHRSRVTRGIFRLISSGRR